MTDVVLCGQGENTLQYTEVMDRIDGRLGPQYTLDQCVQPPLTPNR